MGKGEDMPRKKNKWKKKSPKRGLSEKQKLMAKLHNLVKSKTVDEKDRAVASSLITWYLRRHGLSPAQWDYADVVIRRHKAVRESKNTDKKQYLYGVSDGEMIKLGMSYNPKSRIKELQTSNPKDLKMVWSYYTGNCIQTARNLEKKLHRRCKKYRVRGEWFSMDCFDLVKTFRGQDEKRERALNENDLELIKQSQKMG